MPDEIRTLRDAFREAGWSFAYFAHALDTEDKCRRFDALLDLPIIDGEHGSFVATDLEAGVDAAKRLFNHLVEPVTGEIAIDLRSYVRAILAACGIQEAKQGVATDLEAGVEMLARYGAVVWSDFALDENEPVPGEADDDERAWLRRILAACGIRAVDEVHGVCATQCVRTWQNGKHSEAVMVRPGDTITITRKEAE